MPAEPASLCGLTVRPAPGLAQAILVPNNHMCFSTNSTYCPIGTFEDTTQVGKELLFVALETRRSCFLVTPPTASLCYAATSPRAEEEWRGGSWLVFGVGASSWFVEERSLIVDRLGLPP